MKPKLGLSQSAIDNRYNTLGMTEFISYLRDSGDFDIFYHTERISHLKGIRATILHYNDKKIYLDFWEYMAPTYSSKVLNAKFDLIIKLQHTDILTPELFHKRCKRKKIFPNKTYEELQLFIGKIVPWTFFPSRMMKPFIGKEEELDKLPSERLAFFCGKRWKTRCPMLKSLEKQGIELTDSKQEIVNGGRPLSDDEYIHKMKTSKYGLVLRGRCSMFTEPKNRREIDYMILKKPLLLNYKPTYYNPLIEGKHYIYIDENTNIKSIENQYNIDEIAENGYQWYKDNASPNGVVKSFKQIVADRL